LILAAASQAAIHYRDVPDTNPSHFNAQGMPDGHMSRPAFFGLHLGIVGLLALVFLGVPAVLPRLPDRLINVPRKDYWLAPERRASTLEHMSRKLVWFGCASLALLLFVQELVIAANLPGGDGRLPSGWLLGGLGAYVLFLVASLAPLLVRYYRYPRG